MSGVKTAFLCSLMLLGGLLQAAGVCRIYLDPAAECGTFISRKGYWSLSARSEIRLAYDKENIILKGVLYAPAGKKFSCKGKRTTIWLFSEEVSLSFNFPLPDRRASIITLL